MLPLSHARADSTNTYAGIAFSLNAGHNVGLAGSGCCAAKNTVRGDRCHAAFRWGSHPRAALFDGESCRGRGWRLGLDGRNRPAPQISPTCGLPRESNFWGLPVLHCVTAASGAARPSLALRTTDKARWA